MLHLLVIKKSPFSIFFNMTDVVSVVRALTDVTDNSDEGINSCDKIVKGKTLIIKADKLDKLWERDNKGTEKEGEIKRDK